MNLAVTPLSGDFKKIEQGGVLGGFHIPHPLYAADPMLIMYSAEAGKYTAFCLRSQLVGVVWKK